MKKKFMFAVKATMRFAVWMLAVLVMPFMAVVEGIATAYQWRKFAGFPFTMMAAFRSLNPSRFLRGEVI